MGRPRQKDRMSRMVQARVTDEQYDYLAQRAYEVHNGDLSAAIRNSIAFAQHFDEAVNSPDPGEYINALLKSWDDAYHERRSEIRMDQPGDEVSDED